MDDGILSFWEPNAPKYEERKVCLAYARNRGFRTSVSMEPMLDTPNIESMIKDLDPLVSEDIWLGTMNHITEIKKGQTSSYSKKWGKLRVVRRQIS
jgi:DNA repair photolyase